MNDWWRRMTPSRRSLLGAGGLALAAGAVGIARGQQAETVEHAPVNTVPAGTVAQHHGGHGGMLTVGQVDHSRNGFDPTNILTNWDQGRVSMLPDGRRLREFDILAEDKEVEIAPGVIFPAWTFNRRIPGPTIRVTEGDRVRIRFANAGSHPHHAFPRSSLRAHGRRARRGRGRAG
jgi:manganese oxidase